MQGDVVGCRVKFSADGVHPESITWTRNSEFIGTKSIARIPGLSSGSKQLYFSLGLNRPGEKVLVSTGTSPDLPGELPDSSSMFCHSSCRTFDSSDLPSGASWSDLMCLNGLAEFQGVGAERSLCLSPGVAIQESSTLPPAEPGRGTDGQAVYREPLDFSSRCSSFRTRFVLHQALRADVYPGCLRACAFVLQYGCAVVDGIPVTDCQGGCVDGSKCKCSTLQAGRVRVVIVKTVGSSEVTDRHFVLRENDSEAQRESTSDSTGDDEGTARVGPGPPESCHWNLQMLAGNTLLAACEVEAHCDQVQLWIEYASDSQLLSVFTAEISPSSVHPPPRPDVASITAHLDLVSHVCDRAYVGFSCEGISFEHWSDGKSSSSPAHHVIGEAACREDNKVAADGRVGCMYKIWSWHFEVIEKGAGIGNDRQRLRQTSSKELSAILSVLLEIGQVSGVVYPNGLVGRACLNVSVSHD